MATAGRAGGSTSDTAGVIVAAEAVAGGALKSATRVKGAGAVSSLSARCESRRKSAQATTKETCSRKEKLSERAVVGLMLGSGKSRCATGGRRRGAKIARTRFSGDFFRVALAHVLVEVGRQAFAAAGEALHRADMSAAGAGDCVEVGRAVFEAEGDGARDDLVEGDAGVSGGPGRLASFGRATRASAAGAGERASLQNRVSLRDDRTAVMAVPMAFSSVPTAPCLWRATGRRLPCSSQSAPESPMAESL